MIRVFPAIAGMSLGRRQEEGHVRRQLRKRAMTRKPENRSPTQKDRLAIEFQAEDLRSCVHGNLQNLGVISAFMCALAGNIYTEPVEDPECYEKNGLVIMFWLEWLAMGIFFLSISMTFILSNDINAIPNSLLLVHLRRTELLHAVPGAFTSIGLFLMAAGYGIDIDMRTGCRYTYIGVIAAPLFPASVVGMAWYMKRNRTNLDGFAHNAGHREDMKFGYRWLTTWRERSYPVDVEEVEGEAYLDTLCQHCSPLEPMETISQRMRGVLASQKNIQDSDQIPAEN
jgi:hypothetical protein